MNCKPGDLAVVIGAPDEYASNNGHIVEVLSLEYGEVWNVKTISSMKGKIAYTDIPAISKPGEIALCWDKFLRPISGLPIGDEVIEELKEPA